MKKITFTIFALMLCSIGYIKAQALDTIPNPTFDRWNLYTVNKVPKGIPDGWDTVSGTSYPVSDVFYIENGSAVTRPDYDGKNALSLSMGAYGSKLGIGEISCKFAISHLDPFLNFNVAYFGGGQQIPLFYFTAFTHSATPTSADTAIKIVYEPNNGSSYLDTLLPWSVISIPLTVKNNITPDSAIIILSNSTFLSVPPANPNTELYVSHIWFSNAAITSAINPSISSNDQVMVYPNPFTNRTTIHYNLGQEGQVNLIIYDMQGREIKTLVNGNQSPGAYNQTFDGSGLSNGVYVYKLQTSSGVQTGKLILSK